MTAYEGAPTWRDPILAQFSRAIAAVSRLTVVADPDQLLAEPGVVEGLHLRGFEVMTFEDPAAFRYAHEKRFRDIWDRGGETEVVVVLRVTASNFDALPHDLVETARSDGRLLSFGLAELFPALDPQVLTELDRGGFDTVAAALRALKPGQLGENATRDFLLRSVFRFEPSLIQNDADLLRALLQHHYADRRLPRSLAERLIGLLSSSGQWPDWPLQEVVTDRPGFLRFLQARWPRFVFSQFGPQVVETDELGPPYDAELVGSKALPFGHHDVRAYIDTLFADGLLTPTDRVPEALVRGTWMAMGVAGAEQTNLLGRFRSLLTLLDGDVEPDARNHTGWIQAARRWAEVVALRWNPSLDLGPDDRLQFQATQTAIETGFQHWLTGNYGALHSLPFLPRPTMVHHVADFMADRLASAGSDGKIALVVVDGLAMDQWVAARAHMPDRAWRIEEWGVFAWAPTLTAVSRQSIFAGEPPFFFGSSLNTTGKEPQHWARFWENQQVAAGAAVYACQGTGEDDDAFTIRAMEMVDRPRCRVAGIVVGTIDRMLHGTVNGTDGLHASVRHWASRGSLWRMLDGLAARGFDIVLTADHGNVEGVGVGRPNVGVTADERGERAYVFSDALLRANAAAAFPGSILWPTLGLPDNYLPLIAPPGRAFITEGRGIVAHGGLCLEELIVPFVTFSAAA